MRSLILALLFLCATSLAAQTPVTVQNPSFEMAPGSLTTNANGSYNNGPIQGWTLSGNGGLWQPASAEFATLPDGITLAYSNGATITQDLGATAQAGSYSLSVSVGNRGDGAGNGATYTVSLLTGTTSMCSQSAAESTIPLGTFQVVALSCPVPSPIPSGNLIISLGCSGQQCDFDNVALTFTAAGPPPPPITLNLATKLVWCTVCDRTDDSPMQGSLAFQQNGISNSFSLAADGSVTVNLSIPTVVDPVDFIVFLVDANGNQATGSGWEWKIPVASLKAGVSTLGTLSFGGVAFTKNSDGSVSFAGFLPTL